MDQAKFNVIREGAKARQEAREGADAVSAAVWAGKYEATVKREGGPEMYFGPLVEISVADLFADQSNQDATTKPT